MALDTLITGTNLDAGGNVKTALTNVPAYVGSVRMFSEVDSGEVTGTPYLKSPETSNDYRLRVGLDTVLFQDSFNATTQNTNLWYYFATTLTAAQAGVGTVNFGTVQGTAGTHGAFMRTFQYFPIIGTAPVWHESTWGQFTSAMVANEIWSCGVGLPTGAVTLPADGCWWQLTTGGLIGRVCFNGSFTDSGVLKPFIDFTVGTVFKFSIMIAEEEIEWWVNDVLLSTTALPVGNGQPFLQASLPAFMMKHCTGVVSNTNQMRMSDLVITLSDLTINKPWADQLGGMGCQSSVAQNGVAAQGSTAANFNQLILPLTTAVTNTTIAVAGLGGFFAVTPQATNVAAAGDMILSSYANPVAGINATGKNLYITGVKIAAANGGAAVATTPTTLVAGLAWGHTAVSLATAEATTFLATGTTHAPRRVPLGIMSAAIGTPIGGAFDRTADWQFRTPIVVRPGEFVATTIRFLVSTITASQLLYFTVTFDGYWE